MKCKIRLPLATAVLLAVAATSSCSGSTGQPTKKIAQSSLQPQNPRQTADDGAKLPFTTSFHNRWNHANNGTSFEPCTAATSDILRRQGIDPSTVEDAATVDGQTARGCTWEFLPPISDEMFIQFTVGNSESLQAYKEKYQGQETWRPDIIVDGRTVGVEEDSMGGCTTYVQSGKAGVLTSAAPIGTPGFTKDELCDRAIMLLSSTIAKIPK